MKKDSDGGGGGGTHPLVRWDDSVGLQAKTLRHLCHGFGAIREESECDMWSSQEQHDALIINDEARPFINVIV